MINRHTFLIIVMFVFVYTHEIDDDCVAYNILMLIIYTLLFLSFVHHFNETAFFLQESKQHLQSSAGVKGNKGGRVQQQSSIVR